MSFVAVRNTSLKRICTSNRTPKKIVLHRWIATNTIKAKLKVPYDDTPETKLWSNPERQQEFLASAAKKLNIEDLSDWYKITTQVKLSCYHYLN